MLSDLAFHLAERNHRVLVITSRGLYDDPTATLPRRETIRGVDVCRVYAPRFGRANLLGRALDYFLMYFAFAGAVLRLAGADDLVVAKTDPPLLSLALLPVARLKRAKCANWLQDLYPEVAVAFGMKAIALLSPVLAPLRNLSLRRADANVVIGQRMRARLVDAGVDPVRISVIQNWSDDASISSVRDNPLRREWGLDGKFVVAYSGNLGRAHEFKTLLDAAERLKNEEDLVFLFVGGGALTTMLQAEIKNRRLDRLFVFKPYQPADALSLSLSLPDIFWVSLLPKMEGLIVPSKFYGNCAAERATIFVGDPDGELARLIDENQCGVTVEVGDDEGLAKIILQMRSDPDRLRQMGLNARLAAQTRFSRAAALASWEKFILNLEKNHE